MEDKDTEGMRKGHLVHKAIEQGVEEKEIENSDHSQVVGDEVSRTS